MIGKEGATSEGPGFLQKLWAEANAHFCEVEPLAKRDEEGNLMGIWGAMSDFSRSFQPWEENFTKGLYLAGVECAEDAEAPAGWTKWTVPGYAYLRAEVEDETTFSQVLDYMRANQIPLAGAVHDFSCPGKWKAVPVFPNSEALTSRAGCEKPRARDCGPGPGFAYFLFFIPASWQRSCGRRRFAARR